MNKVYTAALAAMILVSFSALAATAKENLFKLEGAMSAKKISTLVRDAVLKSDKVNQAVDNKDIEVGTITKKVINANFTDYTIALSTSEAGLGPNGPSTHPCTTLIKVRTLSGMTVSVQSLNVEEICAQNAPRF